MNLLLGRDPNVVNPVKPSHRIGHINRRTGITYDLPVYIPERIIKSTI